MRWIIRLLTRNRIIAKFENEIKYVTDKTKILIIDFGCLFENKISVPCVSLIEDLMKSISLLDGFNLLIILKNVETLFDISSNEKETIVKDRYICDLVQELSVINVQTFNRLFVVLSEKPWLLHPSLLPKYFII